MIVTPGTVGPNHYRLELGSGHEAHLRNPGVTEATLRLSLPERQTGQIDVPLLAEVPLDPRLRSSITFDNDTAFARHTLLASACAMATWFCDAYASWQKGAVENANGRLRRDLPRGRRTCGRGAARR